MKKAQCTLALDMDETLCSLVSTCISKCRQLWPDDKFKLPVYGRYSAWFNDSLSEEKKQELYSHIKTEEFYMSLPPVLSPLHGHGTIEDLSRLAWDRYEKVCVITAREGFCPNPEETTREYLRLHKFADVDNLPIHVVDGHTCKTTKVTGSTLFVDDSITVAAAVNRHIQHSMILVSQPWNDAYPGRNNKVRLTPSRNMIEAIRLHADSAEL